MIFINIDKEYMQEIIKFLLSIDYEDDESSDEDDDE
jgi:hypothetical protein